MKELIYCPNCGEQSNLTSQDGGKIRCRNCGLSFYQERAEDVANNLKKHLNEQRMEEYNKALRNLYDATSKKFPDNNLVLNYAKEVKKFHPTNTIANMFELLASKDYIGLDKFLYDATVNKSLTEEEKIYIAQNCIKNLDAKSIFHISNFIEQTLSGESKEKMYTLLEFEAEKVASGIYDVNLARNVFVAHSSNDTDKVKELVERLESSGVSCFVSGRNLRHGINASSEYQSNLQKAMDNCDIFLVVNTKNVRRIDCDVMRVEIPHIKAMEKESFPAEYKFRPLTQVPVRYKKPRINYLVDNYGTTALDTQIKDFFNGFEHCVSLEKVENSVLDWLMSGCVAAENKEEQARKAAEEAAERARKEAEQAEKAKKEAETKAAKQIEELKRQLEQERSKTFVQPKAVEDVDKERRKLSGKALERYDKAVKGDATVQANLGYCYDIGKGVEKDYVKAVYWYTKAAEQGNTIAQNNLGACYEYGQGVEKDYVEAVYWYSKAAEQGNAMAQKNLGVCYEYGQGVEKDYVKAAYWYSKAAEQGNATAQNNLDKIKKISSYVEQGNANAKKNLDKKNTYFKDKKSMLKSMAAELNCKDTKSKRH